MNLYRGLAVCAAALSLSVCAFSQEAKPTLDPTIMRISKMVGGTWRGHVGPPNGGVEVEFRYTWHPDGRGIRSEGVIGKGTKSPLYTFAQFGMDEAKKQVYYLDTHDSSTVYFGHVHFEGDEFVSDFGPAGGDPHAWLSRGHWVDKDTYTFTMWQMTGGKKELLKDVTLRRGP